MAKVTTAIILDTRKPLADGTYRVRLRVTFRRQQEYYLTEYSTSKEDFNLVYNTEEREKLKRKDQEQYKQYLIQFQAIEGRAREIIKNLPVFSFERFEKRFLNNYAADDVFSAFDQTVNKISEEGREGTASSNDSASFSLLCYVLKEPPSRNKGLTREEAIARKKAILARRKPLSFHTVTADFLKGYETWMLSCGNSLTTVGIYVRALRAVFNDAIAAGDIPEDLYPFGKRKYKIPAGRKVKKALKLPDIEKLFTYEPSHDGEAFRRALWIFSYLCNGINVKDIARLRYRNIGQESITFIRAKTERTSRQNLKPVVVSLTPEIRVIIDRWGTYPPLPDAYVFPILTEGLTPKQELAKVRQATKTINKYIKRIGAAVGIEKKVTTYTARHSFSTVLMRAGAPIEYISECLGHDDPKTTRSYVDSFEDNVRQQYAAKLTDFKKS